MTVYPLTSSLSNQTSSDRATFDESPTEVKQPHAVFRARLQRQRTSIDSEDISIVQEVQPQTPKNEIDINSNVTGWMRGSESLTSIGSPDTILVHNNSSDSPANLSKYIVSSPSIHLDSPYLSQLHSSTGNNQQSLSFSHISKSHEHLDSTTDTHLDLSPLSHIESSPVCNTDSASDLQYATCLSKSEVHITIGKYNNEDVSQSNITSHSARHRQETKVSRLYFNVQSSPKGNKVFVPVEGNDVLQYQCPKYKLSSDDFTESDGGLPSCGSRDLTDESLAGCRDGQGHDVSHHATLCTLLRLPPFIVSVPTCTPAHYPLLLSILILTSNTIYNHPHPQSLPYIPITGLQLTAHTPIF